MKRAKALGLSVAMMLTLTALLAASSASAAQFKAEEYPVSFSGETLTKPTITTNTGTYKCESATYTGAASEALSTLALAPVFGECAFITLIATFEAHSCSFVLNSTNEAAPFTGTMDMRCSKAGDKMVLKIPLAECTVEIPQQISLPAVEYKNVGAGTGRTITTTLKISGMSYSESSKCSSPGAHTNGLFNTAFSVKGKNTGGKSIGVFLG
jgi:hypothetical protein